MDASHVAPVTAPPRVLLHRTYRFASWWLKGLGRHAGKILAALPIALIVALVVWIYIINVVCSAFAEFDTCLGTFNVVNNAAIVGVLGLVFLCIATLLARLVLRVWTARRRRDAKTGLVSLRARLVGKDPLADERYASLHRRWTEGGGTHLHHRRVAILLLTPALVLPLLLFLAFAIAQEYFGDYGSLLVFELNVDATNYTMLEVSLVLGVVLEFRLLRTILASRRLAKDEWDAFEVEVAAAAAELVRKQENPSGATLDGPAFTFRAYQAGRSRPHQNP